MNPSISRRALLAAATSATALKAQSTPPVQDIVKRHDEGIARLLKAQDTDPASRWRGIYADEWGLHNPAAACGIITALATAYLQPASKYHRDAELVQRMRLAADLLSREITPDGNLDNPITNFNSPPDTGFAVRAMCTGAVLAQRQGDRDLLAIMEPFLRKAGASLTRGGIHTPNHRWVVCAALAQLNELFAEPGYLRRIDQWLAEGIDIDADGMYDERSTVQYNPIVDSALVVMAAKLKRPELLDYVRRNLESMMYLLHPGYEVVTEISRRQDLNQRGNMGGYWFPLHYMAIHDSNGSYMTLSRHFEPTHAPLSAFMEYPELNAAGPKLEPVPDQYEKQFKGLDLVRIRRGATSASIFTKGNSRIFTLRRGDAVINAVRFASAFFGKAQFVPDQEPAKRNGGYYLTQSLEAPYYQPFTPARKIQAGEWTPTQKLRPRTEVCKFQQSATITETKSGFRVRVQADGTKNVPVTVEINFREGGKLEGVVPMHKIDDGWALPSGTGTYRMGTDTIRFGPARHEHSFVQMRGALPKLSGPSVYLTGFTPFDHTIDFEV
jgi:hypothetical protein